MHCGHTSRDEEIYFTKLHNPAEHPPFCRPDNRAGINNGGISYVGRLNDDGSFMFQNFYKFCSISEIVTTTIGLDKNTPFTEYCKKTVDMTTSIIRFIRFVYCHWVLTNLSHLLHNNLLFHRERLGDLSTTLNR